MKLDQAIAGYWLENQSRLAKTTQTGYHWAFAIFTAYIGPSTEIESITTNDIRRFMTYCHDKKKLSGKSRANIWIVLSSLWTWAEKEPALRTPHIIRGLVQQPTYTQKKIVPYTQPEMTAMIAACDTADTWRTRTGKLVSSRRDTALRDKAILILLVDTGLRASELCALTLSDYNNKNGEIDIRHGKGDKERTVIAGANARKALWRYLATRSDKEPGEPLFATRSGLHMNKDGLRHLVQRVAERTGVRNANLHRFRHTFAINFLRNGGNVVELQRFLGHEQMSTVTIYLNLAQSDMAAAQKLASPADNWRL